MDYEQNIREFEKELTRLINKYSLENRSNTPDFILAKYLVMCLVCVDHAIGVRDAWYGGGPKGHGGSGPAPDANQTGIPPDKDEAL